jgi:hypothetical protein
MSDVSGTSDCVSIAGPLRGQCLCGAVTLTAKQVVPQFHVCHCSMCRRWNGGPAMSMAAADTLGSEIYIDSKPPGYAFSGEHTRLTEAEFLQFIGLA